MAVSVVEVTNSAVVTSPITYAALSATPAAGDYVVVLYRCHKATGIRPVTAITGLGATWAVLANPTDGRVSAWVGTGATTSGNITVTTSTAASASVTTMLVRGLTSLTVADLVFGNATTGASNVLSGAADAGQIRIGHACGFDTALAAFSYAPTAPGSGWVQETSTNNGVAGTGSMYRIPTSAATHSIDLDSSGAGDTLSHMAFTLGDVAGATTPAGSGTGAFTWAGSGTGSTVKHGAGNGAFAWAGSGTGHAPTVGGAHGTGVGSFVWAGVGSGSTVKHGTGNGVYAWAGTAVGSSIPDGVGVGSFAWVGDATGAAPDDGSDPHGSGVGSFRWIGAAQGVNGADKTVTSLTHTPVGIVSVIPLVPVTPLATAVPITRTSILAPVLSAAYQSHPEQGAEGAPEIVEEIIGYPQLWIGSQNVTNLRGVPTILRRWESEAPFGDTVAAVEFPQLNPWDTPGSGDLAFLRKDAPVHVGIVGGSTVRRVWSGFLDARGNGLGDGEDYSWEAKGTFWQAQSQIREPVAIIDPVDIGVQVARTLNAVEGRRWKALPLTPIGITTLTRGSRDESFWDYVQALLSEAITDDLRQWTLVEIAPGIHRLRLKPAPSTVHATVAYGTPGVDIDLRVDESTRVDRVFMRGIGPRMGGWANVYYPGIELLRPPPYPNNDLSNINTGDTDSDTDSGTGVTDWQRRVSEIKSFGNPAVSGVMSSAWAAVVDDLQRRVGVTADGSLGPQTWNATFDRALRGVDMTPVRLPMASKAAANKYLYSATGVKLGKNPAYDPALVVREVAIDVGPGKSKNQGFKLARKILGVYGNAAANGQIVWTTDPNETDRTRLSHLSNIKVKGFEGSDRVVQVSSKSVELEAGEDGPVYVVTTRVDERARDAMAVEDLLEQRRSAQPDPSKRPGNPSKASRQVSDQRTPWDSESPCGVLRRTAVNGSSGLWSIVTVPFAEVGKLAGIRLTSTRPFALAIFASLRITENKMAAIVGNPFATSDPWRDEKGQLDEYGIIEAWGEKDQACGYSPKTEGDSAPFTGDFILDTPVDYWTETVPYVSVAIYMRGGSGWIEGELIPAYEP